MDGGPFRMQRPNEREVAAKPEPVHRPAPQPVEEEPKVVYRSSPVHHTKSEEKETSKRPWRAIIIVAIVLVVGLAGWFGWSKFMNGGTGIDGSKYQAVFFTNGQVYFGKLSAFSDGSLKLTNIFYLQTQDTQQDADSKNPQKTTTDQSNVQLIKLGNEVHGPEDEMIISKEQVLFYENLKPDGKVSQKIDEFNKK